MHITMMSLNSKQGETRNLPDLLVPFGVTPSSKQPGVSTKRHAEPNPESTEVMNAGLTCSARGGEDNPQQNSRPRNFALQGDVTKL